MMNQANCLNCSTTLTGNYCHACGQKASTHRITLKHFILHDLVHGLWHVDKGILFTLKHALLRPGYMSISYIKGERVKYYNFFYLLLLLLGLNVLVTHFFESLYGITNTGSANATKTDNDSLYLGSFIKNNFKLLLFLLIPFFALNGWILFRKLRANIAEHAIIGVNVLLPGAVLSLVFTLIFYLSYNSTWPLFDIVIRIIFIIMALLPVLVYWQARKKLYSFPGFIWRIFAWYLLLLAEIFIIALVVCLITGKSDIVLE